MRITIDARMMGPGNTRGIGRYIEELVRAMIRIAPEHTYTLIVRSKEHPFAGHPSIQTVIANIPWYGFEEQMNMGGVFAATNPDIVHIPHWNVPFFMPCPYVVTIHDLLLRHAPNSANISTRSWPVRFFKRLGYRLILSRALQKAQHILVPTESVKQDIVHWYPSTAQKAVITGEGMPHAVLNSSVPRENMRLLYVGSGYPHKGLDDVWQAWPKLREAFPTLTLRVVGAKDVFMERHRARVARLGLSGIEFIGQVSEDQLTEFYQRASGLLFPSHFEGFGLPPLEALAHGCPVLASNISVLREVLGNQGVIFFRPREANAILGAVRELFLNPTLLTQQAQNSLPDLIRRHNWDDAAQRTLETYRRNA